VTPPEWAEALSAVVGAAYVALMVCQPRVLELAGRRSRHRLANGRAIAARQKLCSCARTMVVVSYEPPDGGRLTVWSLPACGCRGEEDGPW
jgi:hypothetical protein